MTDLNLNMCNEKAVIKNLIQKGLFKESDIMLVIPL
jgi:hypothetical protein